MRKKLGRTNLSSRRYSSGYSKAIVRLFPRTSQRLLLSCICNQGLLLGLLSGLFAGLLLSCHAWHDSRSPAKSSSSLNVYIEDPKLYYALSIYQQQQDNTPISIHLRRGLDMFFQLVGGERPIDAKGATRIIESQKRQPANGLDNSVPRLALGGGLFLSSELPQLQGKTQYLGKLPDKFQYSYIQQQNQSYILNSPNINDAAANDHANAPTHSHYLTPVLLYPSLFQITSRVSVSSQPGQRSGATEVDKYPILRNLQQSHSSRLLNQNWLREQLLETPTSYRQTNYRQGNPTGDKLYFHLQNPRQILIEYLRGSPLQIDLNSQSFAINQALLPADCQKFIQDYRALFHPLNPAETGEKQYRQAASTDESDPKHVSKKSNIRRGETLRHEGNEFARRQQELYQVVPRDNSISYLGLHTALPPSSYPYLYLKGQIQDDINSGSRQPVLQLQLDKVMWAGLSKDLGRGDRRQALKLLSWLQSREGQRALQRQQSQYDSDTNLGIFRGLSLYPEINATFWSNLQLDWAERFDIRWLLPHHLVQWSSELFQNLSFERELLFRQQSALSVVNSFLLPYLFSTDGTLPTQRPPNRPDDNDASPPTTPSTAIPAAKQMHPSDWSLWLQAD